MKRTQETVAHYRKQKAEALGGCCVRGREQAKRDIVGRRFTWAELDYIARKLEEVFACTDGVFMSGLMGIEPFGDHVRDLITEDPMLGDTDPQDRLGEAGFDFFQGWREELSEFLDALEQTE